MNHTIQMYALQLLLLTPALLFNAALPCQAQEDNSSVRNSMYLERNTGKAGATEKPATPPKRKNETEAQLERHLAALINEDRARNDLPALKLDPRLNKLARELAADMARHEYFGHMSSDGKMTQERAKRLGISVGVFENIGSQSGPDSYSWMVGEVQRGFMSEPEGEPNHRYILLHPAHHYYGVGVAKTKDSVIVVQEFSAEDPSTAAND